MNKEPPVGIVILNWNSYEDTKKCIESILRSNYQNIRVWVVDNGSTDKSGSELEDEFPTIDMLKKELNSGFGGGMNTGINQALDSGCEYIMLMNNDVTIPKPGVIVDMVETIEDNPEIGILNPKVLKGDETWFKKGEVNWNTGSARHVETDQNGILQTDYVPFCSTLFQREVFEQVGLLPEEYFLYYEDVAFCLDVAAEGFQIRTNTEIVAQHDTYSSTSGPFGPIPTYYNMRNRILFARRYDVNTVFFLLYLVYFVPTRLLHRTVMAGQSSVIALVVGLRDGLLQNDGKGPYPDD